MIRLWVGFCNRDPSGDSRWHTNLYEYARNDPSKYKDPTGLDYLSTDP